MATAALSTGGNIEALIRKRFKEWFDKSGQSQTEAGAAIEWGQQTVSQYFNGDQEIDIRRILAWCKHFDKDIVQLLGPESKHRDPMTQEWLEMFEGRSKADKQNLLRLKPVIEAGRGGGQKKQRTGARRSATG